MLHSKLRQQETRALMNNRIGKEERKTTKSWITQEMLTRRREQWKWKNINVVEHRRLNNELRKNCKAREKYLEDVCEGIMEI